MNLFGFHYVLSVCLSVPFAFPYEFENRTRAERKKWKERIKEWVSNEKYTQTNDTQCKSHHYGIQLNSTSMWWRSQAISIFYSFGVALTIFFLLLCFTPESLSHPARSRERSSELDSPLHIFHIYLIWCAAIFIACSFPCIQFIILNHYE